MGVHEIVILIYFIGGQARFAGQRMQDIQCKKSVQLSVEAREAWAAPDVDWADIINCPPHYLTLNTDDKEILILSKFQQMKYKEIAQIMNVTENTIKVKVHRAIKKLRENYFQLENV